MNAKWQEEFSKQLMTPSQLASVFFNLTVSYYCHARIIERQTMERTLVIYIRHIAETAIFIIYYDTILKCGVAETREKNEEIHLWMLEQERKKNKARLLRENGLAADEPHETSQSHYLTDGEIDIMSGIEQLENEKLSLENETKSLENEQKQLMQRLKTLYQTAIEELKTKNDTIRETNNELQVRLDTLEESLDSLPDQKGNEVKVSLLEGSDKINEGYAENSPFKEQEKKHKFFKT
jgi:FtsZ-binding cell division protein ZapB